MVKHNKKIILSFDDGPHPVWTEQLLHLLENYSVKAIFFPAGKKVKKYPQIVKKIIRNNHLIGNHTWSHRLLFSANQKVLEKEVWEYHQYVKETFNYSMRFFRPPWGILNRKAVKIIEEQFGYQIIKWNIDSLDYILPYSRKLQHVVLSTTTIDPIIILFHDGIILSPVLTRKYSLRTIEKLLQLKNKGIRFILPE